MKDKKMQGKRQEKSAAYKTGKIKDNHCEGSMRHSE